MDDNQTGREGRGDVGWGDERESQERRGGSEEEDLGNGKREGT